MFIRGLIMQIVENHLTEVYIIKNRQFLKANIIKCTR